MTTIQGQYRPLAIEAVVFGKDALASLPAEVDRLGRTRAFVVTGNSVATKTSVLRRVQQALGPRYAGAFAGIHAHPPTQDIIDATAAARAAKADLIIGLGGSSPTDAAKAVCLMLGEGIATREEFDRYRPQYKYPNPPVVPPLKHVPPPNILIPTTLSAGEFNHGAGVTDETTGRKHGVMNERLAPRVIILDPSLVVETPDQLWCSTGIKALDHAVEMLCSIRHQPMTDATALAAIPLLFHHLPQSHKDSKDMEAKAQCQVAAWLSIWGMNNTRLGLSHAIGHSLGSRFHVPHGMTSCVTLPHVMRWNLPRAEDRLALVASAIKGRPAPAKDAPDLVEQFIDSLGLPTRIRDVGVTRARLPEIAEDLLYDRGLLTNPRQPTSTEELLDLLQAAW